MIDVIGIGSAFMDYFFEVDDVFLKKHKIHPEVDDVFDEELTFEIILKSLPLLQKSAGGASVNTITILASLGMNTSYYGVVGADEEALLWFQQLDDVRTEKTIRKGTLSKCACILSHKRTKRTFISKVNSYDSFFFKKNDTPYLESARFIHIAPFYLDFEKSYEKLIELLDRIKGPKISLTPAVGYAGFGKKKLTPLLKNIDVLFLNEYEQYLITGKEKEEGSKELISHGPSIIACTLGSKGVFVTTQKEQFFSEAKKVKKIVDTTGAGDAFAAGFLYGLLKEKSIRFAANFANTMAGKSVTDFGIHWIPKPTAIMEWE